MANHTVNIVTTMFAGTPSFSFSPGGSSGTRVEASQGDTVTFYYLTHTGTSISGTTIDTFQSTIWTDTSDISLTSVGQSAVKTLKSDAIIGDHQDVRGYVTNHFATSNKLFYYNVYGAAPPVPEPGPADSQIFEIGSVDLDNILAVDVSGYVLPGARLGGGQYFAKGGQDVIDRYFHRSKPHAYYTLQTSGTPSYNIHDGGGWGDKLHNVMATGGRVDLPLCLVNGKKDDIERSGPGGIVGATVDMDFDLLLNTHYRQAVYSGTTAPVTNFHITSADFFLRPANAVVNSATVNNQGRINVNFTYSEEKYSGSVDCTLRVYFVVEDSYRRRSDDDNIVGGTRYIDFISRIVIT